MLDQAANAGRLTVSETIPEWRDGFQRHGAGALDGPLIILLQQDRTDWPGDGVLVGEDGDDVASPFDPAVQSFNRVGGVYFGPMLGGKAHVGQHVLFGIVEQSSQFGTRGRIWSATSRHGLRAAAASS
jgi:hypothetical protein